MAKSKKSVLPSIEVLIVLVLIACFIMWAMAKCNETKALYEEEALEEMETESENIPTTSPAAQTPIAPPPAPVVQAAPIVATTVPPPITQVQNNANNYSKLYIVIDSLNMRAGPHLDSMIVAKLRLFEEVYYLNQVTEFKQKIYLAQNDIANEPWVKIQTQRGKQGWVYGAGVNYYRKKRKVVTPAESVQ